MFKGKCGHDVKKIKLHCIQCKNCSECCGCKLFGYFENNVKFHTSKDSEKKFNSSDRYIAAEIEIAGTKKIDGDTNDMLKTASNKWHYNSVFDGSLPYCGFEITTAPANGDKFIEQINDITNGLKSLEPIITKECGLHIHIDARDFTFHDMAKLIRLYAAIEPIFFSMVPTHRRKSKYCLPCGAKYKTALGNNTGAYWDTKAQLVFNTYNSLDSDGLRKSKYNDARYNALNLHSWFYRGTIEFRLMEGSIDPAYITNWGIMWAKILDFVIRSNDSDIDKIINLYKTADGPRASVDQIEKMIPDDKVINAFVIEQINKCSDNKTGKKKARRK